MITPNADKPIYKSRRGKIYTNVLGVYDRNLNFIYVLVGYEGSASHLRALCDVLTKANGLQVLVGM